MNTENKAPSSVTSLETLAIARKNSRLAAYIALGSSSISLVAIVIALIVDVNFGRVAAVPTGNLWDLPVAGRIYVPSKIEENAKPIHVALRYIRNFYEVDLTDYAQLGADAATAGGPIMVSTKTTQLLPYVLPGTEEYSSVLRAIDYSSVNYRLFNESKCWRRFLADSIEMQDSISGTKRIDVVGRFVVACDDTSKPVPAQNIGMKMISIYVFKGDPTMLKTPAQETVSQLEKVPANEAALNNKGISAAEIAALNPEGWFVIKNIVTPLTETEVALLSEMRRKQGIKPAK